jgi:hypothetical protein
MFRSLTDMTVLRRPDDAISHEETHEPLVAANILVGLGLDSDILTIPARDRPDLILHFHDGADVYADVRAPTSQPLVGAGIR